MHLSADRHLYYFHFFVIINNAAMNISLQIFVRPYVFISPGYIPRSRIAGSYGNSTFISLRNCQTFLKWLQHVTSHQPCMRASTSAHPHQHLLLSVSLIITILVGAKRLLIVFLICISLMANEVEFFFSCIC